MTLTINLTSLFRGSAKIKYLESYTDQAITQAGTNNDIILTGAAPIWLYLKVAVALQPVVRSISYKSSLSETVIIYYNNTEN